MHISPIKSCKLNRILFTNGINRENVSGRGVRCLYCFIIIIIKYSLLLWLTQFITNGHKPWGPTALASLLRVLVRALVLLALPVLLTDTSSLKFLAESSDAESMQYSDGTISESESSVFSRLCLLGVGARGKDGRFDVEKKWSKQPFSLAILL